MHRQVADSGIPIGLAYTLTPILFLFTSYYLFTRSEMAPYLYPMIGLFFTLPLSNPKRNEFIQLNFNPNMLWKIRATENLIIVFPFFLFLVWQNQWPFGLVLLVLAALLAVAKQKFQLEFQIPSPFVKYHFEYNHIFRQSAPIILLLYILTWVAISVNNFNLGIAILLGLMVTQISFLARPESELMVWNYRLKATQFLWMKSKMVIGNALMLSAPIWISLAIVFQDQLLILAAFEMLGLMFLLATLWGKYASFPFEMSKTQTIVLVLSINFPPALLLFLPYSFQIAKKRLQSLLSWFRFKTSTKNMVQNLFCQE